MHLYAHVKPYMPYIAAKVRLPHISIVCLSTELSRSSMLQEISCSAQQQQQQLSEQCRCHKVAATTVTGVGGQCHAQLRRRTGQLAFVSERDGNMELYMGALKGGRVHKHSLNRLTFHPSMQERW